MTLEKALPLGRFFSPVRAVNDTVTDPAIQYAQFIQDAETWYEKQPR
jgi:hypothetical protein